MCQRKLMFRSLYPECTSHKYCHLIKFMSSSCFIQCPVEHFPHLGLVYCKLWSSKNYLPSATSYFFHLKVKLMIFNSENLKILWLIHMTQNLDLNNWQLVLPVLFGIYCLGLGIQLSGTVTECSIVFPE